jgi:hypothetical protein
MRTVLIRLAGLAAMVGGVAFLAEGAIVGMLVYGLGVDIEDESYLAPFDVLLAAGALAATPSIAALYALDGNLYGRVVFLAALVAFVGLGMEFVYMLSVASGISLPAVNDDLFYLGLFVGTLGLLALGILTLTARWTVTAQVLPWWCGAALLAASPSFAYLLVPGAVVGAAWVVVGFAIFRAGRRTERPPRVR